jgi:hypothetical protein
MADHPHEAKAHGHRHAFTPLWDRLGIVASALCLVDCIVLPLTSAILLSFQTGASWADNLHWWLLPPIGVSASMSFYHSFKAHHAYGIVISGASGFCLLVAGEIFEAQARFKGINWVTIVGSTLLISAHLRNLLSHARHFHRAPVH